MTRICRGLRPLSKTLQFTKFSFLKSVWPTILNTKENVCPKKKLTCVFGAEKSSPMTLGVTRMFVRKFNCIGRWILHRLPAWNAKAACAGGINRHRIFHCSRGRIHCSVALSISAAVSNSELSDIARLISCSV